LRNKKIFGSNIDFDEEDEEASSLFCIKLVETSTKKLGFITMHDKEKISFNLVS